MRRGLTASLVPGMFRIMIATCEPSPIAAEAATHYENVPLCCSQVQDAPLFKINSAARARVQMTAHDSLRSYGLLYSLLYPPSAAPDWRPETPLRWWCCGVR
jgi:hypothetical protein